MKIMPLLGFHLLFLVKPLQAIRQTVVAKATTNTMLIALDCLDVARHRDL